MHTEQCFGGKPYLEVLSDIVVELSRLIVVHNSPGQRLLAQVGGGVTSNGTY